jgi:hypothetical protein
MATAAFQNQNRRTVRSEPNPMDKCTVVSIFPKEIIEVKHTIQPGTYRIPPGTYEKPATLTVGSASWWKETHPDEPLLEIINSSIQVANSVVNDYCNGFICCDMNERMPGLFFIQGEHNAAYVKTNHKNLLDLYNQRQRNWYAEVVKMADVLWSRTNGNPLAIPNDARLAARELNLLNKPWMADAQTMELVKCIACGSLRDNNFPVCGNCKAVIDPEKAKTLNLKFIQ